MFYGVGKHGFPIPPPQKNVKDIRNHLMTMHVQFGFKSSLENFNNEDFSK
jgi:hypothetical protein